MQAAEVILPKASPFRDSHVSIPATLQIKSSSFAKPSWQNVYTFAKKAQMGCRCSVRDEVFSVTSSSKSEVDYLGESTKGDLNLNLEHLEAFGS